MTTTAVSPANNADSGARPVGAPERLSLLDVLRGFALLGVFASNLNLWFSGRIFLPLDRVKAMMASSVNAGAAYLVSFFIFGKFISMFAFLFGLGFAIQMIRAEGRGASIVPLYARRLSAMLLIGLVHMFAIWYGDILCWYAVLGFALLLFLRRGDRTLLYWGFGLVLAIPFLQSTADQFLPLLFGRQDSAAAAAKAIADRVTEERAQALAGFQSGSYLTAMRANAIFAVRFFFSRPIMVSLSATILGKFLLGLYAGRRRLFHQPEAHLPLFRRILLFGLVAGVIGNGIQLLVRYLFINKILSGSPSWLFLMPLAQEGGFLGMAMFYVAAITLLFQRPFWRRLLLVLAPVGRMALSNYLAQSAISVLLFYGFGFGLIGELGPALCLAMTFGIFCVQLGLSHLWLARFRFGPAEWLWRSMTYGKAQPMRFPSDERAAAVAASA